MLLLKTVLLDIQSVMEHQPVGLSVICVLSVLRTDDYLIMFAKHQRFDDYKSTCPRLHHRPEQMIFNV